MILTDVDTFCKCCHANKDGQYNKKTQNVRNKFLIAFILRNSRHYCRTENKYMPTYMPTCICICMSTKPNKTLSPIHIYCYYKLFYRQHYVF